MTTTNKQPFSAVEAYNAVYQRAEAIARDEVRVVPTMSVGDAHRQGDVYIVRLPDDFIERHELKRMKGNLQQVVTGETRGARHTVAPEYLAHIVMYEWSPQQKTVLDAMIIDAREIGLRVNHPDHADVVCEQPAVYGIVAQRVYAEELRRTAD